MRVKTSKRRTQSSKLWLERQLNDPYVARAKREGFRSRAAFKLIEIDDKPPAQARRAGGRSRRRARRLEPGGGEAERAADGRGRVVAIDVLDMSAIPGVEFVAARLSRSLGARASRRCWAGRRRRAVRHGGQRHRPPRDRSPQDHGARRNRGDVRPRGAPARRRVPVQGAAGRHRGRAAGRAQARFRHRQARQAGREPADSAELYVLARGFAARGPSPSQRVGSPTFPPAGGGRGRRPRPSEFRFRVSSNALYGFPP